MTGLVDLSERRSSRSRLVFYTFLAGFAGTIVVVGLLTGPFRPLVPWWSIVVANGLAVALAGGYLLRRHPGIWSRLSPFSY